MSRCIELAVVAVLALGLFGPVCRGFELTILHSNDVHAHFEQTDERSGECSDEAAAADKCYGGEARRVTIIKETRARYPNTLILDAGDRFTGTLWFNHYHGEAASIFLNQENYDAVCLGNHEFDRGIEGLVPYMKNLTAPILDANIDISREPRLKGLFNASMIKTVGGVQIGIIGYITKETSFISSPGKTVSFDDEVESVRREVEALKTAGVKLIVGLSHAGYGPDQKIAREVDGIDVIVGGHSHTFLYTGEQPSREEIEGPYPTVITQASGRKVLVVQAYAWGKYMGFLNVTFDEDLEVQSWAGDPILLDNNTAQDPATLALINKMKEPLIAMKRQIVGHSNVLLEGDPIQCRLRECNSGNLLTDAIVEYHVTKRISNDTWALASIALFSGGGIRGSTNVGDISLGQVMTVLPFGNNVNMIRLYGRHVRQAFEHSVANYDIHDRPGAFFQMSGAHVIYDLSRPSGSRVVSLDVRCLNCTVPSYSPLDDAAIYNILMVDFTINGGDGFTVIKNNIVEQVALNTLDTDMFRTYLEKHNPITADTEGRIKFVQAKSTSTSTAAKNSLSWTPLVFVYSVFLLLVNIQM